MGRSQLRLGLGVLLVVLLMAAGTYVLGVDAGSRIHDQSGHTWHHPDAQLFATTKYGLAKLIQQPDYQTNMPIFDGVLSDSESLLRSRGSRHSGPRKPRHGTIRPTPSTNSRLIVEPVLLAGRKALFVARKRKARCAGIRPKGSSETIS